MLSDLKGMQGYTCDLNDPLTWVNVLVSQELEVTQCSRSHGLQPDSWLSRHQSRSTPWFPAGKQHCQRKILSNNKPIKFLWCLHANGTSSSETGNTGHCQIDFLKVGRKSQLSVSFFKSENGRNVWISLERGYRGTLLGRLGPEGIEIYGSGLGCSENE